MSARSTVRLYCEAVFLAGCGAIVLLASHLHLEYIVRNPTRFGVLAAGVLLGEMMPIKIPRRGGDE
ncbi:MAG: hypothetical protein ACYC0H_06725, partial [Solirubrobacteraceae bacterium]